MSTETAKKGSVMEYVNIAIVVLLMFGFGYLPPFEPLTQYGMALLGIFFGLIYGWTVSKSGLAWPSLLGIVALGFTDFGAVSASMAKVFSTDTAALLLFAMLLLGPIMESGLPSVITAKLLGSKFCYKKPWNFNFLIVMVLPAFAAVMNGFLLTLFVLPIITAVFTSAGFKKGDKYPVMLTIGFMVLQLLANCLFPWRGWGLYCTATFASTSGGYMIDYGKYLILAFAFYIFTGIAYLAFMKLMRCEVEAIRDLDLNLFLGENTGKMSKKQKYVLTALVAMIVACIIVSFAGGDAGLGLIFKKLGVYGVMLITVIAMLLVKVDGEPICTIDVMAKNVMWDMLLVIAVAMMIANCLTGGNTGVSELISQYAVPLLQGRSEIAFMMILAVVCLVLTNLLNNMVVMLVFTAVAGKFYAMGIITNPAAALMIINLCTMLGFYTPGSSGLGAMLHGAELSTAGSVYKYGAMALVLCLVLIAVVLLPLTMLLF